MPEDLRHMLHRLADVTEALDEVQQQYAGMRAARSRAHPRTLQLLQVSILELREEAIRLQAQIVDSESWDREPQFHH